MGWVGHVGVGWGVSCWGGVGGLCSIGVGVGRGRGGVGVCHIGVGLGGSCRVLRGCV